jgi:hypothetical protein
MAGRAWRLVLQWVAIQALAEVMVAQEAQGQVREAAAGWEKVGRAQAQVAALEQAVVGLVTVVALAQSVEG